MTTLYSFKSSDELSKSLADFVVKIQNEGIKKHEKFLMALSGGSLPKLLAKDLITRSDVKWDKWEVFYADERLVPLDHEDSNHLLVQKELLSQVPIPPEQVHTIDTKLLDDPEEAADAYEKAIIKVFAARETVKFPVFDLILLGMGPDGHTASLFPGHDILQEDLAWVAHVDDSPKPPPKRITLTLPVLNHAHNVAFVATGEGKKDVMATALDEPDKGLPCSQVRPVNGEVYWFTDDAATQNTKFKKSQFKL